MNVTQIGAQLYTVRDYLKDPAAITASLKKVRQIGYQAVQLSGLGPIDDDELLRILDDQGIICCATHESGDKILSEAQAVAERLDKLNCTHVSFPHPSGIDLSKSAAVLDLARRLDEAGAVLAKAGKVLSYHNHSLEFRRLDGKVILDLIYDNTDPANLQAEMDTYWVQHGGGDPVAWCRRLNNRLPILHLKDYIIDNKNEPTFAEIGSGNLNWPAIIDAAENSGCQWFVVEQDTCAGDPFDSLKKSYEYMRDNLCK